MKRPALRQLAQHLLVAFIGAYGLSVAGFWLLRWLVGESWSLIALFNSFAHLLLIPALILMPLALLLRQRALIVILLPAPLIFLLNYAPVFMPRPARAEAGDLRLMTYNLKAQTDDLDPALSIIREVDADVVALQEVTDAMAARIETDLAEIYPYRAIHSQPGNSVVGQAVLSRYPLLTDEFWRVNLAAQRVTFNIDGRVVALYNAHPMQPGGFAMRAEDISDILARAENDTGPVVLAGDFNMSDQSEDYRRVASAYHDAYRTAGWGMGFTFPADLPFFGSRMAQPPEVVRFFPPLVRLDYVFHNDHLETMSARVWPESGGSDHLPVVVTLAFAEAE